MVFLPFHYGYWDTPPGPVSGAAHRAANELTLTDWDPVSKQPIFKTAAAALRRIGPGRGPAPAPANTASAPVTGPVSSGHPAAEVTEILDGQGPS